MHIWLGLIWALISNVDETGSPTDHQLTGHRQFSFNASTQGISHSLEWKFCSEIHFIFAPTVRSKLPILPASAKHSQRVCSRSWHPYQREKLSVLCPNSLEPSCINSMPRYVLGKLIGKDHACFICQSWVLEIMTALNQGMVKSQKAGLLGRGLGCWSVPWSWGCLNKCDLFVKMHWQVSLFWMYKNKKFTTM